MADTRDPLAPRSKTARDAFPQVDLTITDEEKQKIADNIALAGKVLFGTAPTEGSPHPGVLDLAPGVKPMLGMVAAGSRVGPRLLQQAVMAVKNLADKEKYVLGEGLHGTVYRVPNMPGVTMKMPNRQVEDYTSKIAEEAAMLAELRNSSATTKKYLGSVMIPNKDLQEPRQYSDLADYMAKGLVKPKDVSNAALFTREVPSQVGLDKVLHDYPNVKIDMDALRSSLAEFKRMGLTPADLHMGNIKWVEGPKGLVPHFIDMGFFYKRDRPIRDVVQNAMNEMDYGTGFAPKALYGELLRRSLQGTPLKAPARPDRQRMIPKLDDDDLMGQLGILDAVIQALQPQQAQPKRVGARPTGFTNLLTPTTEWRRKMGFKE